MGTAVLVHGAWQGAWCWQRAAELEPGVDLATHLDDVLSCLDAVADDGPAVLVAHSYSGMLVPGVVARGADVMVECPAELAELVGEALG